MLIFFNKKGSYVNLDNFPACLNRGYASAMIVHIRANQIQMQLLIDQFDTLPFQYRRIGHWREKV